MSTTDDLPAALKADPEPTSTEIPQVERKIARSIIWVVGHWTVISMGFGALAWAIVFGWGQLTSAFDRRIEPLRASLDPIKAAVEKASDHEGRIKVVEARIGDIHADVREIRNHLLKGEPMRKSD